MKKRQEKVLSLIVKEYVKTAEPVSSQVLFEKYKIKASPATLRLDMVELTEEGYLIQPHTSAGRVPTEKAYHFYINKISSPKLSPVVENKLEKIFKKKKKEEKLEELGKFLSAVSRNVSLLFFEEALLWQGLSQLFSQPEFYSRDEVLEFTRAFEEIYDNLKFGMLESDDFLEEKDKEIKVFIGRKNPFVPIDDLSLIITGWNEGVIGLLGPRRMDYYRNIALIKKAKKLLEENF